MTLIGGGFVLTTHTNEIFNIESKNIYDGLNGFKKDCAYKPRLSVNLEGYINYRQEYYDSGSIPHRFTLQLLLPYFDIVKLLNEINDYLIKTKAPLPPIHWTLEDNRIKGVNPARTLTDLNAPLVFNTYNVVPDSSFSYTELGELYGLINMQLVEI